MADTKTTDIASKYGITAEDLTDARDNRHLSWRAVANELKLGSPATARRAYSALVRPHTESILPTGTRGGAPTPLDLAGMKLAEIRDALVGKKAVIQRSGDRTEAVFVAKVTSVKAGTVNFNDGAKSRSAKAEAIIATK